MGKKPGSQANDYIQVIAVFRAMVALSEFEELNMIRCIFNRGSLKVAASLTLALVPLGLSAAPNVYVPAGEADRVLVVDSAIDKVVRTIDGIANSHGLSAGPQGQRLYVGSLNQRAANQVPAKPAGMSEDEHLSHHAGGTNRKPVNISLSGQIGTAYQIDVSSEQIVRKIDVPGAIHHTLITRDGRYGVSTHPVSGQISVVDLDSGTITAQIATGSLPNYIVSDRDGSRIWVSNTGNNTVSEIDTGRWIVRRNMVVEQAPEHMVLSADESSLYVVANGSGQVVEVELEAGEVVRRHPVGSDPHGIDVSDDGTQLFVAVKGDNRLAAIQLATGVVRTLSLGPAPYHLLAVRNTGKLYVASRRESKLWVVGQRDLRLLGEIPISGVGHQMAVIE